MGMWDANSDRDYRDVGRRTNATCPRCQRPYWRNEDDTGNLCDDCCDLRDRLARERGHLTSRKDQP